MKSRNIVALIAALAILAALVMGATTKTNDAKMNSDSWGEPSEGFQLSAYVEKKQFKVEEPIVLKLTIRNVSKKVLYLTDTNPESDYKIIVKNEQGERVPLTKVGQHLLDNEGEAFRVIGVKVKPGEEKQDRIEITRLHAMTVPGTYSIVVK